MTKQPKTKKELIAPELSLQHIVQSLVVNYQKVAVHQNSFFVNEVPASLAIAADKKMVVDLLRNLFSLVTNYCRNTCIKISAKAYHDVIVMHIKDTSTFNNTIPTVELQNLQTGADKIGGLLEITSQRKKETTIAFSFVNQPVQHQ
ncbi:MAG: HAMP domain-containing histidine kinase [Bacteroidetes bacterium]|nr:HAMP domain-containing histidine kinase [Bacteroidota bacterium]